MMCLVAIVSAAQDISGRVIDEQTLPTSKNRISIKNI